MRLGIFPLQLVAFPAELVSLHIFEPRYKQLIRECMDEHKKFVIVPFIQDKLTKLGTLMEIVKLAKDYGDGRMDIHARGLYKVKINRVIETLPMSLYSAADVVLVPDESSGNRSKNAELFALVKEFEETIGAKNPIIISELFLVYDIVQKIGLNLEQKYSLLEMNDEEERQDYAIDHLRDTIPFMEQIKEAKERINMNGHFPPHISPEL